MSERSDRSVREGERKEGETERGREGGREGERGRIGGRERERERGREGRGKRGMFPNVWISLRSP